MKGIEMYAKIQELKELGMSQNAAFVNKKLSQSANKKLSQF